LEVWDEIVPGLGLRVSGRTDKKTWFIRYRTRGRQRRQSLGPYPAKSLFHARAEAKLKLGQAALGRDPARPDPGVVTVREIAKDWLERHARPNLREYTVREYERQLKAEVYPALGNRRAADVTRRDVHDLLDRIVGRDALVLANRVRSLLGAVLDHGVDRFDLPHNVVRSVKKPAKEKPRKRVLSPAEVKAVWNALSCLTPQSAAAVRLLFLTAQRKREVLRMSESHVDGDVWTIPPEHHKAGRRHTVPLTDPAVAVLDSLAARGGWYFPSPRAEGPRRDLKTALKKLRRETGLEEPWTLHDIRRTVSTQMGELCGVPNAIIGLVLGHKSRDVTATTYSHAAREREKREALEAWGAKVEEIVRAN
jgi:integrase